LLAVKKIRAVVILLFVAVLAACSKEPTGPEEPVTLNVLAWNEKIFNERYGDFFIATHPNYDIRVISVAGNLKPGED
jgi:multiple sugar transport system substrate-binding protein